jgi:hypothetical protein
MLKEQVKRCEVSSASTWVGASVSQQNRNKKSLSQVISEAQEMLSEAKRIGKKLNREQDQEGIVILR